MNAVVYENLKVIWDYMKLDMALESGDCVVGFGCYNDDIALRCAQLYRDGYAPRVLFTGGLGRNTLGLWTQTEAERFASIAMDAGVPREDIIIENRSTNSAENILFTHAKLEEAGLDTGRLICVHKPFMERRLYAAMQVYWPEAKAIYTSPQLTLEEYIRICRQYGKTSVLEIKNHFEPEDIENVIAIIRGLGWLEHTIFISFDLPNMICIREKLPEQAAQYLVCEFGDDLLDILKAHRLDLDIDHKAVTPENVAACHAGGIAVNVWTVDTPEDAQRALACGVDYITSNILE